MSHELVTGLSPETVDDEAEREYDDDDMRLTSPIMAHFFLDQSRKRAGRRRCWCVDLPASVSPTGKRRRTFVSSARAARELTASLNAGLPITDEVRRVPVDYETARRLLENTHVGLVEAVAFAVEVLKSCGSIGNARQLIQRGVGGVKPGNPSCAVALEGMNAAKCNLSPATLATRAGVFARLWRDNPDLAEMPVALVTGDAVQDALTASWPTATTCWNNGLRELRALFSWCVKQKHIAVNPALEVDFLRHDEQEIVALSPEQVADILLACRPATPAELERRTALAAAVRVGNAPGGASYDARWMGLDTTAMQPAFALMAFAGVRPREVTRLTWGDISLEDGVVSVRGRKSKTGGTRHIIIRPVLRAWLEHFGEHDQDELVVPPASLKFRLTAVHRRAGFDGPGGTPWQPDALRHTFASMVLKSGAGLAELEQDMGHADASMLRSRYLNMRGITAASAARFWALTPQALGLER